MGLSEVQRSEAFVKQTRIADEYYKLLDSGVSSDSPQIQQLEIELDELEEKFGDRVISGRTSRPWPARSPDLRSARAHRRR